MIQAVADQNWTESPSSRTTKIHFIVDKPGDKVLRQQITVQPDGAVILHQPMTGPEMLLTMLEACQVNVGVLNGFTC